MVIVIEVLMRIIEVMVIIMEVNVMVKTLKMFVEVEFNIGIPPPHPPIPCHLRQLSVVEGKGGYS